MTPPRLFLRFAVLSGIALVVALVLTLLVVRHDAQGRARGSAVGDARALAAQLSADNLSTIAFQYWGPHGRRAGNRLGFVDDFFAPTTAGNDPATVVLYSPSGLVTYAVDRTLVGTRAPDAPVVQRALRQPQYRVANGLQDAYVPVRSQFGDGGVLGVLRLEHDYGPVATQIRHDFVTEGLTVALALIALYLAMLPVMRRVTSSLHRSYLERAELAAIVDHSNDAIVGQTPDGLITSWNAGAEAVYGWTADEAVGRPIDMLLAGEPVAAAELDVTRTTHVRRDGSPVTVSVTISPIRDAGGALVGTSMIARDVTELSRLEQELHESHRQEAVGRLAGGIARDLARLLAEIDVAAGEQDLAEARRASARGAVLVEQLLAIGGVQEMHPELLDLNGAVRAAAHRVDGLVGSRVAVELELEEALGVVVADPEQVQQLILNLVANARESLRGAGGRIVVRTENVNFARRARDGARETGHYVMFAVSDTGSGREGSERMTLGLAAAAGIVRQSGGTMGIESRPQGGTVVRVYLPRANAEELAEPVPLRRVRTG